MSVLLLVLSGSCSALASILLRIAGQAAQLMGIGIDAQAMVLSKPNLLRLGAVGAYGLGFVLYAVALKRIELSIAYPLMVVVTVIEIFIFGWWSGEALSLKTVSGAMLLGLGVFLLYSSGAPRS